MRLAIPLSIAAVVLALAWHPVERERLPEWYVEMCAERLCP